MTDPSDKNISKINIGGVAHDIKDAAARAAITTAEGRITTNENDISSLKNIVKSGSNFLGKVDISEGKTEALTDGATTQPIFIIGQDAAVNPVAGSFVVQGSGTTTLEFIWDGEAWRELGSTGTLKALAFADKGTATLTPAGAITIGNATAETASVTDPTFKGTPATLTGKFTGTADQELSVTGTPKGTISKITFTGTAVKGLAGTFTGTEGNIAASYTPEGTVTAPTVKVVPATATFKNLVATMGEGDNAEVLTLTTPEVTYATGVITSATATAPAFTGKAGTATATFTPAGTVAMDTYTPEGTVSTPTFTGTALTSVGKFTPAGTIAMDSYTPEGTNSGTAVTLKAHNHGATFKGTEATITVTPA